MPAAIDADMTALIHALRKRAHEIEEEISQKHDDIAKLDRAITTANRVRNGEIALDHKAIAKLYALTKESK